MGNLLFINSCFIERIVLPYFFLFKKFLSLRLFALLRVRRIRFE